MAEGTIKYSDLFPDDGGLDNLIKKIGEVEKEYLKLSNTIQSEAKKVQKETEKTNTSEEQSIDLIKKKEKEVQDLAKSMDDLQKSEEELNELKKRALKLGKEEQRLTEKRNSLTTDAAKRNANLKVEISELNKELKQQARESQGLVGEYEKQSKQLIKLRKEYKDLAAAGKENSQEARELLMSVTELDAKLKDIDKSVGQTGRQVGNYKDQVKEALEETGAFNSGLADSVDQSGILGDVLAKLTAIISILTKAKDVDSDQTKVNIATTELYEKATNGATRSQRLFARAQLLSAKSTRILSKALKASGIGLIIGALTGLVAFLTKTQEGLIRFL